MTAAPSSPNSFFPTSTSSVTPAGTVIPLSNARYVLRGKYFDPLQNTDAILPPHRFALINIAPATLKAIVGEPSDASGTSWIAFEDDQRFDGADPKATWALVWVPLTLKDGKRIVDPQVLGMKEVFVDLEKQEWVSPMDVGYADTRKLLRLPIWASVNKAKNGGFVDSPPKTKFAKRGFFSIADGETTPHGTADKPWIVQIDHKLFRNYVRFHYYDLKDLKRKPVPRGVVVEALGKRTLSLGPGTTDPQGRVAAGTGIDDSGTVYLLHERSQANSKDVEYYFATGARGGGDHGVIVFADPKGSQLHLVSKDPSDKFDERYRLPQEWHSHGMQPWVDEASPGRGKRGRLDDLRLSGTDPAKPLCFHLDDAVLAQNDTDILPWPKKPKQRVALFDHLLAIRDADVPRRPDVWKVALSTNYLRAEDAVYVDGKGIEQITRLVYLDGDFYDLRERRLRVKDKSQFGKAACLGARIAMKGDTDGHAVADYSASWVPNTPGLAHVEYHLIDVSYVRHDVATPAGAKVSMKLMHLLVHRAVNVAAVKGASKAAVDRQIYPALIHAAERWDQAHPGHPNAPDPSALKPSTFVMVPSTGIVADDKCVLARHYFGATTGRKDALQVKVGPAGGRAATSTIESNLYLDDLDETNLYNGIVDVTGQDAARASITVAHEFGHAMGHPDDYGEDNEDGFPVAGMYVDMGGGQTFYNLVEGVPARVYGGDLGSMMNLEVTPRLRHYWVYTNRLAAINDFRTRLDNKDYVALDNTTADAANKPLALSSNLTYTGTMPPPPMANIAANDKNPFKPIAESVPVGGKVAADLAIYRAPTDFGTVTKMFEGPKGVGVPLAEAERFDGFALVHIRFLFDFTKVQDIPKIRKIAYGALHDLCVKATLPVGPKQARYVTYVPPFVLTQAPGAGNSQLRRIAILIAPQYERTTRHRAGANPHPYHVSIRMVAKRTGPHPLLSPNPPVWLELEQGDLGSAVLSHVLGAPTTSAPGSLKTKLEIGDFDEVRDRVNALLGANYTVAKYR